MARQGAIQTDVEYSVFGRDAGLLGSDSNFHAKHPPGTPEGWLNFDSDPNKPGRINTDLAAPLLLSTRSHPVTPHRFESHPARHYSTREFSGRCPTHCPSATLMQKACWLASTLPR
jgi:hypothetical protein